MPGKWQQFFKKRASTAPLIKCLIGIGLFIVAGGLIACQPQGATPEPSSIVEEPSPDYTGKKVLWVDSYHQGYEWSDGIEAGLRSQLDGTGVDFNVVRLDTKRNPSEEFGHGAALKAKAEIEAFEPDVLIASDDNAQLYLVAPYFKGTDLPVVFNGVNWDTSPYEYDTAHNVTGMVEVELPTQLVTHLKNYAEGDRIGYLTVDSNTERKVTGTYNERFFDGKLNVQFVKTLDEFKENFIKLQEEVDLLLIGNNAGLDRWDEAEVAAFILENTKIPTGTLNDWLAPYTLITLAKAAEEQGEWAGSTALKILDGTAPSEIPSVENKQGRLILNMNVAEQLDLVFSPSLLRYAEVYGQEGGTQ